jgi:hypothetical protein
VTARDILRAIKPRPSILLWDTVVK